ncbi:MAG: hypothetical protein EXQ89_06460 [Rhodospirillaceae bacterium]|nr:hypothetical protein [Rhodospirillaceae bacterium]
MGSTSFDPNDPRQLRTLLVAYSERVERAERRLAAAAPKAEAYDDFIFRDGEATVDQVAKMLFHWSERKLFARLRDVGWLDRREGVNTPRGHILGQGLLCGR